LVRFLSFSCKCEAGKEVLETSVQCGSCASLQIKLNLSPILMTVANSCGGVMGKMIDAQSIVIGTAATSQIGKEGEIFRKVFWHSLALAAIVGGLILLLAYVFPSLIPHG
jgi:L-lactate permease